MARINTNIKHWSVITFDKIRFDVLSEHHRNNVQGLVVDIVTNDIFSVVPALLVCFRELNGESMAMLTTDPRLKNAKIENSSVSLYNFLLDTVDIADKLKIDGSSNNAGFIQPWFYKIYGDDMLNTYTKYINLHQLITDMQNKDQSKITIDEFNNTIKNHAKIYRNTSL